MVRAAYTLHAEDDDWGQAGTLVREVLDDAARERLVDNIVGHLLNGVSEPVLQRAFEYWRNVDKDLGDRIEAGVRAKQDEKDPKADEQANPARIEHAGEGLTSRREPRPPFRSGTGAVHVDVAAQRRRTKPTRDGRPRIAVVDAVIWHNPRCSKSRGARELLTERGVDADGVPLPGRPADRAALEAVLPQLGTDDPLAITRTGEARFRELGLKGADRDTLLDALAANPILVERPIVATATARSSGARRSDCWNCWIPDPDRRPGTIAPSFE